MPIIGTAPESIDLAEDRRRFGRLLDELKIPQPKNGTALVPEEAVRVATDIGFPVLVRPSYVLGGRAMVIAYDLNTVQEYVAQAALMGPARPVLIDQFLEEATEVDVDALADGEDVVIGGVMEHIEEAGVHSGDSSCVLPPVSLSPSVLARIRDYTKRLAKALQVVGLMNVQYAIQRDTVYVLEVNPRASRTVPYVSKATGVPLAKVAARLMAGRKLRDLDLPVVISDGVAEIVVRDYFSVKSPVFPFSKFRGVDTILGPEMRSTGEVMGVSEKFRPGFCQGATGRRAAPAAQGLDFPERQRSRQAALRAACEGTARFRFPLDRHARHGRGSRSGRSSRRARVQSKRRPSEHRGSCENWQSRYGHQHATRPRIVLRREIHPSRGDSLQHPVHHDALRRECCRSWHSCTCRASTRSLGTTVIAFEESCCAATAFVCGLKL